jgi:hypothetical protein
MLYLRYGHLAADLCSFESAGCIYEHHDSFILIRLVLAACFALRFFLFPALVFITGVTGHLI